MKTPLPDIFPTPASIEPAGGLLEHVPPTELVQKAQPAGHYRLELTPGQARLEFSDEQGRQSGLATLAQLEAALAQGRPVPAMRISDGPVLKVRGFMLDISRGRVPSRQALGKLVRILWLLKFNQLQLYMEHTFAYSGHETVWKGTGALNGDDLLWLDDLCARHGIELVPNQNCFGHMEQWLRHKAYKPLAECPDGFEHPHLGWRSSGSVLRPGPESAKFIDGLLAELLPHFRSGQVNIGCDETWELGQGASSSDVRERGSRAVFMEHLQRLLEVTRRHGRQAQFWADIFLGEENRPVPYLPDCRPVVWGYEPGHPFAPALERLARAQYPFLVAPGTSCWNSFGGRWETAAANIPEAVAACREFGGEGMLLTSWGDNGHGYPFAVMLPPMILAAAHAWSGSCPRDARDAGLRLVFGWDALPTAHALLELGRIDSRAGTVETNMSGIFRKAMDLPARGFNPSWTGQLAQREAAAACLEEVRNRLNQGPRSGRPYAEVLLATDLTELALVRAANLPVPENLAGLRSRFEAVWRFQSGSPIPESMKSGIFRGGLR